MKRRGPLAAIACLGLACSSTSKPTGPMDAGGCKTADGGTREASPPGSGTGPALSTLGVSSSSDSSLALVPSFSPGVHDYYVRCSGNGGAPASNRLVVSATAPAGVSASIAIESPGGARKSAAAAGSSRNATLTVESDQAIVLTATAGKATEEYWVRCLPDDFPEMQWTPHGDGCSRPPGYYLLGTMSLPSGPRGTLPQEGAYAIVLDANGVPVWYQRRMFAVIDVETLSPGDISFAGSGRWEVDHLGGGTAYPAIEGDGGALTPPDDHELRILPNGRYLGLFSPSIYGVDLTGLTLPLPNGSGTMSFGKNEQILACEIKEFDASGHVYWQWSAIDHFDPVKAMVLKGDGDLATEGYVEPFHCNAVDVDVSGGDANTGNLLVSARHMSSVFYVEKKTGTVLWKMGGSGPSSSLDHPPPVYVPVDDPFVGQHDARLLPGWKETCAGGSGQVSLFDDESYTMNPARGVIYDVNVAGGCGGGRASTGGTTGATLSWKYATWMGVPSSVTGSMRVTADGSRVIDWGQSDPMPNGLVFTEVDEHDNDLLDLVCPDDSSSYRTVKVPLTAFDLTVLRENAGQ